MTQWGLDTLFNPAKRHMDEEKRRLQSTREEVGDNSGGKRIDFATGKVKIRRGGPKQAAELAAAVDEPATADATDGAVNDGAVNDGAVNDDAAKADPEPRGTT